MKILFEFFLETFWKNFDTLILHVGVLQLLPEFWSHRHLLLFCSPFMWKRSTHRFIQIGAQRVRSFWCWPPRALFSSFLRICSLLRIYFPLGLAAPRRFCTFSSLCSFLNLIPQRNIALVPRTSPFIQSASEACPQSPSLLQHINLLEQEE